MYRIVLDKPLMKHPLQDNGEEHNIQILVNILYVFQRHPDGVAQVTFREPEGADACVALLNGHWFGQRKITAETWDGKTKYK